MDIHLKGEGCVVVAQCGLLSTPTGGRHRFVFAYILLFLSFSPFFPFYRLFFLLCFFSYLLFLEHNYSDWIYWYIFFVLRAPNVTNSSQFLFLFEPSHLPSSKMSPSILLQGSWLDWYVYPLGPNISARILSWTKIFFCNLMTRARNRASPEIYTFLKNKEYNQLSLLIFLLTTFI